MVRRGAADTSSAFALLEHADEEGYIENIDDVLEQLTESKPAKAAAATKPTKQKPPAVHTGGTKTAGSGSRSNNVSAAGSSRAATEQNDTATNKLRAEDYYRAFQHVFKDASTGEVVLRFHKTNIVRIKPNGDIILNTGGWYTYTTLAAMNDALYALDMRVSYKGALASGAWAVTHDTGRIYPYQDNMVIPAAQPHHKSRGAKIMQAYCGGAEVPVYAAKADAAGLKARSTAAIAAANRQGAVVRPGGLPPAHTPVNYAVAAATIASYAGTARSAHMQQQQHTAAVTAQQQKASYGCGHAQQTVPRKSVHEQLQEAVEQLGLEDELLCGDEHLCVVCLEHTRDEVLVPCGHMVLCRFCCDDIMKSSKECPVCREEIVDHCTLDPHEAEIVG